MIQYDKLYKLFENWDESKDNYLGSMFVSIYNSIPICYYCQFDKNNELIVEPYYTRITSKEPILKCIDDRILLKAFINHPDKYEIVNYSPSEHLILGKQKDFLCILTINESGDKSLSSYQTFYMNRNDNFEDIINEIKPYFESTNKHIDIDFGIAAVDVTGSLYTTYYDYKKVEVDVKKNYNDDIPYERMKEILTEEENSALLLFYGDPGTGKSTMIKHFIGEIPQKDFVFVDGSLLANVQQDKLMSYFLENQDTVFIFEDCEKILLSREHNYNPTMSILLNLTDGIISDVLNIKIICTFNTSLNNIDKALLRKGRLTMKYEFKKLDKEKVKKLLNDDTINQDMSLADIYHYKEENDYSKKQSGKIGFT